MGGVEAARRVGLVELLLVHPAVLGVLDLICERRGEREAGRDGKREREGRREGGGETGGERGEGKCACLLQYVHASTRAYPAYQYSE